jgi:hypothetical protein
MLDARPCLVKQSHRVSRAVNTAFLIDARMRMNARMKAHPRHASSCVMSRGRFREIVVREPI